MTSPDAETDFKPIIIIIIIIRFGLEYCTVQRLIFAPGIIVNAAGSWLDFSVQLSRLKSVLILQKQLLQRRA